MGDRTGDSQLVGMGPQGVDHELDVVGQFHPEQFHSLLDDLPIHLSRKRLVLELLLDALRLQRGDALRS